MTIVHRKFMFSVILGVLILLTGYRDSNRLECDDLYGCVTIAPGKSVEIGVMQVLSGPLNPQGLMQVRGIEMYLAEQGNQVLGHPVHLNLADSGCSAEAGVNAALLLTTNPAILGIVGTYCSGAAKSAMPIISKAGMVMISGTNSAPSLTSNKGVKGENWYPGYFRVMYNGIKMAQMAAVFAYEKLGLTRAATINDGDNFTKELTVEFEKNFTDMGGKIVRSIAVNKGDTDMIPVLEAIVFSDSEVIYFPLFEPEAIEVISQAGEMAQFKNISLIGSGGAQSEALLSTSGKSGLEVYLTIANTTSNEKHKKIVSEYEERYGEKPAHFSLPYVYDATGILISAIESVAIQDPDGTLCIGRKKLRNAIYGTKNFHGITGRLSCDAFGDLYSGTYSVVRFGIFPHRDKKFGFETVYQYK